MKICSKCKKEKNETEFGQNKYCLNSYCKSCVREVSKNSYIKNKEQILLKRKNYIKERREWYNEFKSTLKCEICTENHISCLEFHHLDPKKKEFSIGVSVGSLSKERVLKEIEKCKVLCSNCHRKLHWEYKIK